MSLPSPSDSDPFKKLASNLNTFIPMETKMTYLDILNLSEELGNQYGWYALISFYKLMNSTNDASNNEKNTF